MQGTGAHTTPTLIYFKAAGAKPPGGLNCLRLPRPHRLCDAAACALMMHTTRMTRQNGEGLKIQRTRELRCASPLRLLHQLPELANTVMMPPGVPTFLKKENTLQCAPRRPHHI